jgi:hypothetical protein
MGGWQIDPQKHFAAAEDLKIVVVSEVFEIGHVMGMRLRNWVGGDLYHHVRKLQHVKDA